MKLPLTLMLGKRPVKQKGVEEFLVLNPLAKIVIVLDTHSTQGGDLVNKVTGNMVESDTIGPVCAGIPQELQT